MRRAQLLETGARLFTERGYDGVSMSEVAREAGISKGLLYHYFSGKEEFFAATLAAAAQELAALTATDPAAPPLEQVAQALDAYLAWIDEHAASYVRLLESVGSLSDVSSLVRRIRDETVKRIVAGFAPSDDPPPPARESPCTAGCGSWTAPACSGWSGATCRAGSCATYSWVCSRERSSPPAAPTPTCPLSPRLPQPMRLG